MTGASRGFGALITAEALAAGDAVVATARDPKAITERFGSQPNLLAVALDVVREDQAQAAVAAALKRFGRIDVLVNNAGYGLLGAVEEAQDPEVERLFATNVFGLLAVTRAVLPQMRRQRSGHVINFSSLGGYAAYPGWGVYGGATAASALGRHGGPPPEARGHPGLDPVHPPLATLDQRAQPRVAALEPVEPCGRPASMAREDQQPEDKKNGAVEHRHDDPDHAERDQAVTETDGSDADHDPLDISIHSVSDKTVTPSSRALSNFEPASVPATT